MRPNLTTVVVVATIAMGCGPFQVIRGPGSCAIVREHQDAFSGTYRSGIFYFGHLNTVGVGLVEHQQGIALKAVFVNHGVTDGVIEAGTPLEVALADGGVMQLVAAESISPVVSASRIAGVFTQWSLDAHLTPEHVQALASTPVLALRTQASGMPLMMDVPRDPQARLQTVAICFAGRRSTPPAMALATK